MVVKSWRQWALGATLLSASIVGIQLIALDSAQASHWDDLDYYDTYDDCDAGGGRGGSTPWTVCPEATIYNYDPESLFHSQDFWEALDQRVEGNNTQEEVASSQSLFATTLSAFSDEFAEPRFENTVLCFHNAFSREDFVYEDLGHFGIAKYNPPAASSFDGADDNCNEELQTSTVYFYCPQNLLSSLIATPLCVAFAGERQTGEEATTSPDLREDDDREQAASVNDPGNRGVGAENFEPSDESTTTDSTEADSDGSEGLTGEAREGCDEQGGLNWAFCSLLWGVSNGIEIIERQIYNQLQLDREQYQPAEGCGQAGESTACNYRDAWTNMRNLMTLAIVGTALLMVIASALDFGWFSNYTVKKYLARLIVGVILLTMSWAVGDFIILLGDQLGKFVGSAITAPFGGTADGGAASIGLESIFNAKEGGTYVAATVGVTAGVVALSSSLGVVPIMFTALLGLLAILTGFMFLIFRQIVIIALLVFSPVGVALWFLPGSDKAWRLYYRTFLSLVMIYPIIVAVIAFGRVFIWVLLQSEGAARSPFVTMIAFLVYVGMFAAIPFLFKRFLGVINQLTGSTNNPAKGLFDRLKNARQGYMDRKKNFDRLSQDRKDDTHLSENQDPGRFSRARMRDSRIRLKRAYRHGAPILPIRQGTRKFAQEMTTGEEGKRHGDAVELLEKGGLDQKYDLDPNNFGGYLTELEDIANGEVPTRDGRPISKGKVSFAEHEASLRKLATLKQDGAFRRLHKLRGGNASLDRAWMNLVRGGVLFDQFNKTAIDVAKNQIEPGAFDLSEVGDRQLQTQGPAAIKQMENSLGRLVIKAKNVTNREEATESQQKLEDFGSRVTRLLDNKMAVGNMPPGTYDALKNLKTAYEGEVEAGIDQSVRTTINTAKTQGWSVPQYEQHLSNNAVRTDQSLVASSDRRAAIRLAAATGHEDVLRNVCASDNPAVQNSLKAAIKADELKKGSLGTKAPHIASLRIDDDGKVEKVNDIDWLKLGLDSRQLGNVSVSSAKDMHKWVNNNLQKARADSGLRRNLKSYSSRYVKPAADNVRASQPDLARIFDQIDGSVDEL